MSDSWLLSISRARFSRAEELYQRALEVDGSLGDQASRAVVLGNLGQMYASQGHNAKAEQLFTRALEATRVGGNLRTEALLMIQLARVSQQQGNVARAIELYSEALNSIRKLGDMRLEGRVLLDLSSTMANYGRHEQAEELLRRAIQVSIGASDERTHIEALRELAIVLGLQARTAEAFEILESAVKLSRQVGDVRLQGSLMLNLGSLLTDIGRHEEAIAVLQETVSASASLQDRHFESLALGNLARSYIALPTGDRTENLHRAIDLLSRALQLVDTNVRQLEYAAILSNLATAYASHPLDSNDENLMKAIAYYQDALTVYTRESTPQQWAETLNNLATTYLKRQNGDRLENLRRAIDYYEQALLVISREVAPNSWLLTVAQLCEAYSKLGDWPRGKQIALSMLETLRTSIVTHNVLESLLPIYLHLSAVAIESDDPEFAVRVLAEAAYSFELHNQPIPESVHVKLAKLKEQLGRDRFVIVCAEARGAVPSVLAQTLQDIVRLMGEKQFGEAHELLTQSLESLGEQELTPQTRRQRATLLLLRGRVLREQSHWQEGLADQREAFTLYEELRDFLGEAEVLLEIGFLYELMNNYEDARIAYMDSYRLFRRGKSTYGMAVANENLGRLENRLQMFEDAIKDLEEAQHLYQVAGEPAKAIALQYDLEDARSSKLYHENRKMKCRIHRRRAYMKREKEHTNQKDYDKAKVKFTQAVTLDPQEPYYFARGYVYLLTDDHTHAWSDFERGLMLDGNSVGALSGLGFISKMRGDYITAISFYTRAIQIAPRARELYRRRAQVYLAAGMNDKYEEDKRVFGAMLMFEQDDPGGHYIL